MRRINGEVVENGNRVTITYPDGMELGVTGAEMERIRAIKARPEREGKKCSGPRPVPKIEEFNATQRRYYSEVAKSEAALKSAKGRRQ
ncbi:MAG: hypothetical protein IMZ71_03750 [Chloroflexi bacterium]|nr:hypothetical protein [Chloroflexota bacterium]